MGDRGGFLKRKDGFATKAIHAGYDSEAWPHKPVVAPLVMSSTFTQIKPGEYKEFFYGRLGNPNRTSLEQCLAALEDAKYSVCFSSGIGTVASITNMFNSGSHFIVCKDLYGGSVKYFDVLARRIGMDVEFIDVSDLEVLDKSIKSKTKMVFMESPTNPKLKLFDIKAIAEVVHKHPGVILVVDNTFLTPYFQRPLDLGADITMYSLTKYMNGHSDVIMGATVTNDEKLFKELQLVQGAMGAIPSPYDCYQVYRSLKTLPLRMDQHFKNSQKVAEFLEQHSLVACVNHPGLPSHPQHQLALKQTYGHSGIMSFEIKGGMKEAEKFFGNLKLISLSVSLGGPETLTCHPAKMTHDTVSAEQRQKMGVTDSLVRLSVGLESAEELIRDLDQALKSIL